MKAALETLLWSFIAFCGWVVLMAGALLFVALPGMLIGVLGYSVYRGVLLAGDLVRWAVGG